MDLTKFTPRIRFCLEKVLFPMFDGVPEESIVLNLITKISQVNLYKRTRVRYYETDTLVNVYALNFMPSGEGKDVVLNWIDRNLMVKYREEFQKSHSEYREDRIDLIDHEAQAKFPKSQANKESYKEQHRPRILAMEASDGTLEGFLALREAYSDTAFGGTFIKISEFGDYITSENNARKEFMSAITEVYDNGNTKAKIIKSEKDYRDVEGVPCSINFHTSLAGLLEGEGRRKLLDFLNRGLGRRAFTCVPEKVTQLKITDYKQRSALINEVSIQQKTAVEFFGNMVAKNQFNACYSFTSEANEMLFNYRVALFEEAKKSEAYSQEALTAEIKNRYWKVVKLSGVIASFERPGSFEVTVEDLIMAIEIASVFGLHFRKFFDLREMTGEEKFYNYLKSNVNNWVTRTEIRRLAFGGRKDLSQFLKGALESAYEKAEEDGYKLLAERAGKSGYKYMLVSQEKVYEDFARTVIEGDDEDHGEDQG